jgi:hypothetical protein
MIPLTEFLPRVRQIQSISNSNPTIVTTSVDHGYVSGLSVRIFVPYNPGMENIAGRIFPVTPLALNTFSIPFDSTRLSPFLVPGPLVPGLGGHTSNQFPQCIPVGEFDSLASATDNVVI